ncbi:hypothetical protein CABS01_01338 [Colletotrichum abscissum]|uniref:Uncharacterized protein n=1 Tax=Colletotrichum abscissum TaxID=1671311 RepID=A0A9P9XGX1_9PEZI|nr:uncharacterized protein CABS01_01338 [Colletotrichum abscissum]KAI3553183.1 hypothetical protein CABS02_06538 [Colletotrichum abscissum]KAK1505870.1 hypothetical protein CABS01_01338 [Colletotrichum abscissum]
MTTLTIRPPTPSETPQIASIHISPTSSNTLLPLQFPTSASLADLHDHLVKDALHYLRDHDTPRILLARVSSDPDVVDEADADADADAEDDDATGTGNGERVIAFVKRDIVRRRGQGGSRSRVIETPTASASGSRRLEPGNILPTTAEAGVVDDGSKEQPPRNQQHHQQSKAEVGEGTIVGATAEDSNHKNSDDDDESEDEEWPASANREYLTAYATAASKARREAMGSRPFLLECPTPFKYLVYYYSSTLAFRSFLFL